MTQERIKELLLKAAGNPETGGVFEIIDDMARAIWEAQQPKQEQRVVEVEETR